MEIKNWQAFLVIAQRGSMHVAAEAMHLSQPAHLQTIVRA